MVHGIDPDWYASDSARALRGHMEKRIDQLVGGMRNAVRSNSITHAAWHEGSIAALEQLRSEITPERF